MSTEDIVEKMMAQRSAKARDEGLDQGLAEAVITMYEARFGTPPANIVALVEQTHDRAVLLGWLERIGTGSAADDVAAALQSKMS